MKGFFRLFKTLVKVKDYWAVRPSSLFAVVLTFSLLFDESNFCHVFNVTSWALVPNSFTFRVHACEKINKNHIVASTLFLYFKFLYSWLVSISSC